MITKLYSYWKIYGPRRFWKNAVGELRMLRRGPLQNSYSQNSEDVLIDRLLGNKKTGFYVDVGAYDPSRLSNTKRFYKNGWTGINIEPDPRKIEKFYKLRARDLNLNVGVANKNGRLDYFEFEPLSSQKVVQELRETPLKIKQKIVKLSQERLGIYFNSHVVRSLNLKKGEELYISVPDKKHILLELGN